MIGKVLIENPIRGRSSVGRALHWQCRGHGFESHRLHFIKSLEIIGFQGFFCVPGGFYLVVHDCLRQSWFLEKKAFGKNVRHELLKMSVKKTDYGILHIIGRPLTLFLCIWAV